MRSRVREMTVTMSVPNKKIHMSVSSLATCAMNALVTEYPHDWKQMPDIERRRLVNMYLNSFALHRYGLNEHFNPHVLVQPPPRCVSRKRRRN